MVVTYKSTCHTTFLPSWISTLTVTLTLISLVLVLLPCPVSPEAFTSIASLKTLVRNEDWLLDQVDRYIAQEEERLNKIRRKAEEISDWTSQRHTLTEPEWDSHVTKLVEHPISAFNLIKNWVELTQLTGTASAELYSSVTNAASQRGVSLPESEDYQGAIAALIRLQKTYSLPTPELAVGRVYNTSSNYGLDKRDCMEMGRLLMNVDHSLAFSWFDLLMNEGINDTYQEQEIYRNLVQIYKQCGDLERAIINTQKIQVLQPNNMDHQEAITRMNEQLSVARTRGTYPKQHYYWKSPRDKGLEPYESLCRGDNIKNSIFVNKDLVCIYRKGPLPYVQFKEEIHSFDPRISLLIDVITDKQADLLKSKAFPSLNRAHVGDPSKSITSEERVGKVAWLWDTDPDVAKISQKVSYVTGMSTKYRDMLSDAEAFQIVNYGMGGQYEPHFDFYEDLTMLDRLPTFIHGTGDRISTFMFYLSEVKAGGATVFPNLGIRVPPVKNAAAYWYNYQLHGETGDRRTLHAGCPVLLGQKWVGNKWIRQTGQVFRRPCALDKNQIDPIWYS